MTSPLVNSSSSSGPGSCSSETHIIYRNRDRPRGSTARLPSDRRATIHIFIIEANLNVLSGSIPRPKLPPGLRPIVDRLVEECRGRAAGSGVSTFCQGRVIRAVPMVGAPTTYVISVERYMPYANLRSAVKRYRLSPRELDVLMLALEGKTASETAECLAIAISTTTDYLNRLLSKTGARNKSNLIAKVLGWDILGAPERAPDAAGKPISGEPDVQSRKAKPR